MPYGPAPDGHLVGFDVCVRADADSLYVVARATPESGDQWDDAFNLGLGSSANVYLDTNVDGSSDVIIEPLAGDYCAAFDGCANPNTNIGPAGPSVYTAGTEGAPNPAPVGGVREIAVPWSVLQTDPDGLGFPLATCSTNVRTVQGFGYNFSGSQFADRFGTVSQAGCATPVPGPHDAKVEKLDTGGKDMGLGGDGKIDRDVKFHCQNKSFHSDTIRCVLEIQGLPTGCTATSSGHDKKFGTGGDDVVVGAPGGLLVNDVRVYPTHDSKANLDFKLRIKCTPIPPKTSILIRGVADHDADDYPAADDDDSVPGNNVRTKFHILKK